MLRPLWLKMGIMRLCATEQNFVRLCQPEKSMLRPLRLKMSMLQLCATEVVCTTLCDPKQIWCDFARPQKGMLRPLRLKMGMLHLCGTKIFSPLFPAHKNQFATLRYFIYKKSLKWFFQNLACGTGSAARSFNALWEFDLKKTVVGSSAFNCASSFCSVHVTE